MKRFHTTSALSRQIALLEDELGVSLFLRTKPRLTLTREGEALYAAVSNGLDVIRSATKTIRRRNEGYIIVVNAAIGFTSLFLLPRLGEFQSRFPHIKLQIVTRDQNPDFNTNECDCLVIFGDTGLTNTPSAMVLGEELIPVCTPDYLPGNSPIPVKQLADHELLHMTSYDHADDWQIYSAGTGLAIPASQERNCFHSYMVYVHAIQNGNGIGLGWGKLIDAHLDNGTLAVACEKRVKTGRGYHCCLTNRGIKNPAAKYFFDWIGTLSED